MKSQLILLEYCAKAYWSIWIMCHLQNLHGCGMWNPLALAYLTKTVSWSLFTKMVTLSLGFHIIFGRLKFKMGIPVPLRWFFLVYRGRACWQKRHLAYQSEDIRKYVDAFAIHQARKLSFNCWTRIVWFYSISTVRHPNALLWRNSIRHYYDAENGRKTEQ